MSWIFNFQCRPRISNVQCMPWIFNFPATCLQIEIFFSFTYLHICFELCSVSKEIGIFTIAVKHRKSRRYAIQKYESSKIYRYIYTHTQVIHDMHDIRGVYMTHGTYNVYMYKYMYIWLLETRKYTNLTYEIWCVPKEIRKIHKYHNFQMSWDFCIFIYFCVKMRRILPEVWVLQSLSNFYDLACMP